MTRKATTVGTVLVAALGIWAGFRSWGSASKVITIYSAAAMLIGGNLIFMTVLWIRARPGSGDALFLPHGMLLSVSMLVGLVPQLLWPSAENFQIGASIVSIVLTAVVAISGWRRLRSLRARPS